jgi:hypothetical protein
MFEIRGTRWGAHRSIGVATVIIAILGIAMTLATWGSDRVAGASTTSADPLPVTWTGDLSGFPGAAWQRSWGVQRSTAYRVRDLQRASDPSAPGGAALVVRYGAGSAGPRCADCPAPGGVTFRTAPREGGPPDLTGSRAVELIYDVKFPHEFDFGTGGVLPGLYGTVNQPQSVDNGVPASTDASPSRRTPSARPTWTCALVWRTVNGVFEGGLLVSSPADPTRTDASPHGLGRWQLSRDDQWHEFRLRVEPAQHRITVWYDKRQMFSTNDSRISAPARGIDFSSYFGGQDSSWGPRSNVIAEFSGVSLGSDGHPAGRPVGGLDVSEPLSSLVPAPTQPARADPTGSSRPQATPRTGTPTGTGRTDKFYVTLYGAHDNTPANSRDIAYPVIHKEAGGTGTFEDPLTFATDKRELPVGTIVYYPYLKRYFIMEDDCTECDNDWSDRRYKHIDLWAGASNDPDIERCEASLTQDGQVEVIVGAPDGLPVDRTPLYDGGKCYSPRSGS